MGVFFVKPVPFLVFRSDLSGISWRDMGDGSVMVEVETGKRGGYVMKMKTFQSMNVGAFPHTELNASGGVFGGGELSLATQEGVSSALRDQGVSDY